MIHKVVDIVADASRDDLPIFDYRESLVPIASGFRRYDNLPFRAEFGDHILWQIYNDEVAPLYCH